MISLSKTTLTGFGVSERDAELFMQSAMQGDEPTQFYENEPALQAALRQITDGGAFVQAYLARNYFDPTLLPALSADPQLENFSLASLLDSRQSVSVDIKSTDDGLVRDELAFTR